MQIARDLQGLGFSLVATRGTANYLRAHGIDAEIVFKVNEGRPHVGDEIVNHRIQLVINTPLGRESFFDDKFVRRTAMMQQVPCITTLTGAAAAVYAIRSLATEGADRPLAAGVPRRRRAPAAQGAQSLIPPDPRSLIPDPQSMSAQPLFDVVGVGANSIDFVYRLPAYPVPDGPLSKLRISSHERSPGRTDRDRAVGVRRVRPAHLLRRHDVERPERRLHARRAVVARDRRRARGASVRPRIRSR